MKRKRQRSQMKLSRLLENKKAIVLELQQKLLDEYDVQLPIKVEQLHGEWFCVITVSGVKLYLSERHNPAIVSPKLKMAGAVPLITAPFAQWDDSIDDIANGLPAAVNLLSSIQEKFGALDLSNTAGDFSFELKDPHEGAAWLSENGLECAESNRELIRYNIDIGNTTMWYILWYYDEQEWVISAP